MACKTYLRCTQAGPADELRNSRREFHQTTEKPENGRACRVLLSSELWTVSDSQKLAAILLIVNKSQSREGIIFDTSYDLSMKTFRVIQSHPSPMDVLRNFQPKFRETIHRDMSGKSNIFSLELEI